MDHGTVRAAVLCGISGKLNDFVLAAAAALDNEVTGDPGEELFFKLPTEGYNSDSWEALVSYAYKGEMDVGEKPNTEDLIDMWLLGQRFEYPAFQDRVMLDLLDDDFVTQDDIWRGFHQSPPGSKLRCLMAEEAFILSADVEPSSWTEFECIEGFLVEFVAANKRLSGPNRKALLSRSGGGWKEFMVERTLCKEVRRHAQLLFES